MSIFLWIVFIAVVLYFSYREKRVKIPDDWDDDYDSLDAFGNLIRQKREDDIRAAALPPPPPSSVVVDTFDVAPAAKPVAPKPSVVVDTFDVAPAAKLVVPKPAVVVDTFDVAPAAKPVVPKPAVVVDTFDVAPTAKPVIPKPAAVVDTFDVAPVAKPVVPKPSVVVDTFDVAPAAKPVIPKPSVAVDDEMMSVEESEINVCTDTAVLMMDAPPALPPASAPRFSGKEPAAKLEAEPKESRCSESGVLFNGGKTMLIQYPADKQDAAYEIPAGVKSIGDGAFAGCAAIKSVTIPATVTKIGGKVFAGCTALKSIIVRNPSPPVAEYSTFDKTVTARASLQVPADSVGTYRNAFWWSKFKNVDAF